MADGEAEVGPFGPHIRQRPSLRGSERIVKSLQELLVMTACDAIKAPVMVEVDPVRIESWAATGQIASPARSNWMPVVSCRPVSARRLRQKFSGF